MVKRMFSVPLWLSLCCAFLFAQDVDRGTLNTHDDEGSTGLGTPAPEQKKPSTSAKGAAVVKSSDESESSQPSQNFEDEHFIQSDDYFISEEAFATQSWIWVSLAKMATPPSAATKKEAEFLKIHDGNKVWTKYYYKTAIAKKSDLKLGTVIIAFNDNNQNDIYSAPDSKENSRGGSWFMGKIIDMSDLYKGYVTVAGNYKVSPKNLRIKVK